MIIYELNNGEAAHKRKQFSHFSCKMVQAQLLKFFKKKDNKGMIFPWLEFKDILLT